MRALYLLHDHVSSGGFVASRLRDLGWDVEERVVVPPDRFHSPAVDFDFPDPVGYDLLVPGGAPWSAYDDGRIGRWLLPELAWLRSAHRAGVPMLAICFGAQALSRALGGTVAAADRPEIGYVEIDTDVPELVGPGPWFQWHADAFTVPPGGREIARNGVGSQAFLAGRSLAVQFHPEVTPELVAAWLANGGVEQAERRGIDPNRLARIAHEQRDAAQDRCAALVDAFLATTAGFTTAPPVPRQFNSRPRGRAR